MQDLTSVPNEALIAECHRRGLLGGPTTAAPIRLLNIGTRLLVSERWQMENLIAKATENAPGQDFRVMAVTTGEHRQPKGGEWYLRDGAAFRLPSKYGGTHGQYDIARLVLVNSATDRIVADF